MKLITGFKKVQYGDYEYFNPNATPSEILTQMPKKLKKLIRRAGIRKMGVWDIDMGSFTIIFKAASLVGGPAEERATIGFKANLLTPVFDEPGPIDQECVTTLETDKSQMEMREAVNTIQWVQEYVQATGEEHKDVYVEGLERVMNLLMGKEKPKEGKQDE